MLASVKLPRPVQYRDRVNFLLSGLPQDPLPIVRGWPAQLRTRHGAQGMIDGANAVVV